jgi:hypothetical protein
MNAWDDFEETSLEDPVVDLDRLVDMLIEHYGLKDDGSADDVFRLDCGTTH